MASSFVLRRCMSTSTRRLAQGLQKWVMAIPAPLSHTPALETAELQQAARKAQGSWKEMDKEEMVQLYRCSFPYTYKEMASESDYKVVIPGVIILISLSAVIYQFLRTNYGPKLPHTYQNPEWDAAIRERLIRDKANPIEGISSRHTS